MVMYFPGAGVISDISTAAERGGFYGVFSLGTMVIATYLSCHNTNCNLDRTYSWSSDRRCVSSRTWMEVIISNLGFLVCITNSYEVFILVFVYCGLVVPLSTLVVGLRIDLFLAETSSYQLQVPSRNIAKASAFTFQSGLYSNYTHCRA